MTGGCYKKMSSPVHFLFLDEARLIDIPFPVGSKLYYQENPEYSDSHATALYFAHDSHLVSLEQFYQSEMERLGWNQLSEFGISDQIVLVFEKPHKICTLIIKPQKVELFIGPKR